MAFTPRNNGDHFVTDTTLTEIQDDHKHSVDRMIVQDVPGDRRVLTCHECQGPIAENRNDGHGWRRL